MRSLLLVGFVVVGSIWASSAEAHLGLEVPASRYGSEELKPGPCGIVDGQRTANVTYYEPGETIEVRWNEYVDHPGHYRIAFDADGDDDFVDPATMMELYSNDAVLLDGIADRDGGGVYTATVTLPDVTCENCTLQVIQMMYDKPPYITPGNDIYYQCADLVLRRGDTVPDGGVEPDAGTGGNGGTAVDGGVGGSAGADGGPRTGPGASNGGGCSATASDRTASTLVSMLFVLGSCLLARRRELHV